MAPQAIQTTVELQRMDIIPPCKRCGYNKYPYPKSKITKLPKDACRCGPPVEYHPKYCQELIDYFSQDPVETVDVLDRVIVNKKGERQEFFKTVTRPSKFLTLESFARKIGIGKRTFDEWVAKYPELTRAYEYAKQKYKEHLIVNGMEGRYNAAFTMFVATNTTDMKDKREVDNNNNLNVNISLTSLFHGADAKPAAIEGEVVPAVSGGHSDMAEDAEIADIRSPNVVGFTPAAPEA